MKKSAHINWKQPGLYVLLFALFMLILMPNLSVHGYWFTDEADNALAGMAIADGRLIYVDYLSQHMPLLYYICALFRLLGATAMIHYRIMFYVLLALMWTCFFGRNRRQFGAVAALTVPLFFFFNMYAEYASFVLSEHLQAWGMAVLFFEFRRFYEKRTFGLTEGLWVALAVFASFGCAFVSVFPIALVAASVLVLEIFRGIKNKERFLITAGRIGRRYAPVAAAVLVLLVLLFLPQILTGHLYDAYYGAYYVNRTYYAAYQQGGYGSSIISSVLQPFVLYVRTFRDVARVFYQSGDLLRIFLCYGVNLIYIVWGLRGKKGLLLVELLFLILCGSRGFGYDFHALPYFAVTMCQLGLMTQDVWNRWRGRTVGPLLWKYVSGMMAVVLLAGLGYPYGKNLKYWRGFTGRWQTQVEGSTREGASVGAIRALTEEDETVILASVNLYLLVYAQRHPVAAVTGVPWMYDAYKEETLEQLYEEMPRVAVYDDEYVIWDHPIQEYAPEFTEFMEKNYVLLDEEYEDLYVRADYYEEARARCGLD